MKIINTIKYLSLTSACAAALLSVPHNAVAAPTTVPVAVEVLNTLTVTKTKDLNFGKIGVVSDGTNVASIAVDTTGTLGTPASGGGTSVVAVIDNTAASEGEVSIADGAPGATVNVTLDTVVAPVNGTSSFDLDTFRTRWNAVGTETARALTGGTVTWTEIINGSLANTLSIGATLKTKTTVTTYADGVYSGSFNLTFSY